MAAPDTKADVADGRWDLDALWSGVSICVVLAVPFRIVAAVVDSDAGAVNALLFLAFLGFFVIGAGVSAWTQRTGTPMSHALVTAIGTYLVVEAVFVVVRAVRGTRVPWFGIAFTLTLVVATGLIGGALGNRLQARGVQPRGRVGSR